MDDPTEKNVTPRTFYPPDPTASTLKTHDKQAGNFVPEDPEKIRRFLIWVAALLAILSLISFILTRDFHVLAVDILLVIVYGFYFPRHSGNRH